MPKSKHSTFLPKISRSIVIALILGFFYPILGPGTAVSANPPTPPAFPSFTSISYGDINFSSTIHLYFDDSVNVIDSNTGLPTWSIDYSLDSGATWVTPTDQEYSYMHCYGPDTVTRSKTVCWFDVLHVGDYSVLLRYGNYLPPADPLYSAGTPSEEVPFRSVSYTREDYLISNVQTQPLDSSARISFTPPVVTQYVTFRNVKFAYSLAGGDAATLPSTWHYADTETSQVDSQPSQTWEIHGLTNYEITNYIVFGYYIPDEPRWFDFASYDDDQAGFRSYLIYAAPSEPPTITSVTPITYTSLSIQFDPPSTSTQVSGYKYSTDNWVTWLPASSASPFTVSTESSGTPLSAGGTYQILMRAIYHDINGDYDGIASNLLTTTLPTQPAPITIMSPGNGETFTGAVGQSLIINSSTSGGSSPIGFSITGGLLPPGTALNSGTGTISGSPTTPGLFPMWITATDAYGETSTVLMSVRVPQPSASPPDRYTWHFYQQDNAGFYSVASSADGRNLIAGADTGIYISHNYGESWETSTATDGPTWISVASNSDGSELVALDNVQNVWISRDFGATWSHNNNLPPNNPFYDCTHFKVTSDSTGEHLSVICNAELRGSDDYGLTWSTRSLLQGEGDSIYVSSSGRYYAIFRTNQLFLSSDNGSTFAGNLIPTNGSIFTSFAFSGDETKLYAGDSLGNIYFSNDFGITWDSVTANFTDFGWGAPGAGSLTSNFDGSILGAVVNYSMGGSEFFASVDAGHTWVDVPQYPIAEDIIVSAASADGFQVVMSSIYLGIWVGPYVSHVASLASSSIKGVSLDDFGTPSRNIAGTEPGHIVLTSMVGDSTSLASSFIPSVSVASIGRVVKYSAGSVLPSAEKFLTDEPFDHQVISDGDFFIIKVVAQDSSAMYYRINVTIDFKRSLHLKIGPTFGPTVIGQSETQTVTITGLSTPYFNPAVFDWQLSSANSDFSILDASNCGGGVGGQGIEFAENDKCQILIQYTPSAEGASKVRLQTRYEWQNGNGFLGGSLIEYLYLEGSGLPTPVKPNQPLVWESQTVVSNQSWRSIASSADGVHLSAVYGGGSVYTSSDSGKTWIERTNSGQRNWTAIASSSDGMRLAAVVNSGNIFTSTDGGLTWIENEGPISPDLQGGNGSKCWTSISSSSDGTKLAIVDDGCSDGGDIYTSSDGGETWIDRSHNFDGGSITDLRWSSIASSYDGQHLAAVAIDTNYVYLSNDQGATWRMSGGVDGPISLSRVVSNSDGSNIAVVTTTADGMYDGISPGNTSTIYTSQDFVQNWNYLGPDVIDRWTSISMSLDGSHIASVSNNGYIYLSTDFGTTWESMTAAGQQAWTTITMSADGALLTAGTAQGDIWTLRSLPPAPAPIPTSNFVFTPSQRSIVTSISPEEVPANTNSLITIAGVFEEKIFSVVINGSSLAEGSWSQSDSLVVIKFPPSPIGKYSIQLLNGSAPLIDSLIVNVVAKTSLAQPVVNVPPSAPTPKPTQTPNSSGGGNATKPLKSTLVTRVYFDLASFAVKGENLGKLKVLARTIAQLGKSITITVTGYAQPTPGSEATDGALSKNRAKAVARILRSLGVNTSVTYLGAGRAAVNAPSSRYVEITAANK